MKKFRLFSLITLVFAMAILLSNCKGKNNAPVYEFTLSADPGWFVKQFANNHHDSLINNAVYLTDSLVGLSEKNYFDVFLEVWDANYADYALIDRIRCYYSGWDTSYCNSTVTERMKAEFNSALDTTVRKLELRLKNAGAEQLTVEKSAQWGCIHVKTDSVMPVPRFEIILTSVGSVEFYETYSIGQIATSLFEANRILGEMPEYKKPKTSTLPQNSSNQNYIVEEGANSTEPEEDVVEINNPLFDVLMSFTSQFDENGNLINPTYCQIGYCAKADSATLVHYLQLDAISRLFPGSLVFAWMNSGRDNIYEIIALKTDRGLPAMTGENIVSAKMVQNSGNHEVQIEFNSEGANNWASLTRHNIDKSLAMVIDGNLVTYPRVMSEITGGKASISGNFSIEEASDMSLILGSGALPLKLRVVKNE